MIKTINNKKYKVFQNEFDIIPHNEYNNLKIFKQVDIYERLIGFLSEIKNINNKINQLICFNTTHGGFLPLECAKIYESIVLLETDIQQKNNIQHNIELYNLKNIYFNIEKSLKNKPNIVFCENYEFISNELLEYFLQDSIIITGYDERIINNNNYIKYKLTNSNFMIYVNNNFFNCFKTYFNYYISNYTINYDNLINLCIMVKNAGPQFEDMLIKNLPIIDKWTILDTGSTDETINIINKILVGKKTGNLYQENFINFCDSRNRLLELAGTSCKYIIMLDDTYIIEGNLRNFLNEVRGDQYANSFTLLINSDDTQYGSNRIIKSDSGLKYIYKIHEVISDKNNINIFIPEKASIINDRRFDYMEKRTMERKKLDLELLYQELNDDSMNPRTYYYLAQTYNLLEDYDKAFNFFLKRVEFINSGFIQERIDSIFEAARIANFKLNKPWHECLKLYENCFKMDESRPESVYFIGIHYFLENNFKEAYKYLKKGFEIGFPKHCQYSLKPTISYHFLPKFLTRVCYDLEDYKLGEEASGFFLLNNKIDSDDYNEILSWHNIYKKLNIYTGPKIIHKLSEKPIFCFVADGGFDNWSGSNILTKGVGGSETYIIEMAKHIQKSGRFNVYVFCNTPYKKEEIFEGTIYKHLDTYYEFVNTNYILHCVVSRYSEYLPISFKGFTENVYLVVHDLTPSGIVIPMDIKLKQIFCLTEWHVSYFNNIFPKLKDITVPFYYGCDFNNSLEVIEKIKYKFIYSSFPNRGLLQLLQMWPSIYNKEPKSTLHIYSDVDNKWSNEVEPEKMNQIKELLQKYSNIKNGYGIYYHGWVNKKELAQAWKSSDIWFYPCTFMETFCLTALEAALSKTFVITNDLAGLQNTVGNRGCIIPGDATTTLWQEKALDKIFFYLNDSNIEEKNTFIEKNYKWSYYLTWEKQAKKLLNDYILPNSIYEYKGMYNWTNDLPYGNKKYFLDTIEYFNNNYYKFKCAEKIKVLEIGTYTGISLINIINNIPNSIGIGIDLWESYDENDLLKNIDSLNIYESFVNNIKTAGLENRIQGIKMSSTKALFKYIKNNEMFDFIYIDGSHLLLDCYSDLILSWEILETNGILAIDDYYYKNKSIIESPFEAINHFLKKYEKKYKLLHKEHIIFIQKI
jgi:hypothetical protein